MMDDERLIGRFTGQEKGPLMVCFAGMHGNEAAGIEALQSLFKMLEREPEINPSFGFKGRLVGLKGNMKAIGGKKRYIVKDLNRQWKKANIDRIYSSQEEELDAEDRELRDLLNHIRQEIEDYQPEKLILLDLHTTSAFGGIFTIVNDDPESLAIGSQLHAPVVKGILKGISGTTLHYFTNENFPVRTVAVSFEAGQHEEPLSVQRTIAAIINCLRTIGCVRPSDVENKHDSLLIEFSKNLPKITELIKTHQVYEDGQFQLLPGFKNFQRIQKGQLLGYDKEGPILSPEEGLILMPRYQDQGEDGFFLIRAC